MHDEVSRRSFLSRVATGAGAAFALSALPQFAAAHEHAASQLAKPSGKFEFFTASEAKDLSAVCEQIIPSDPDSPGAREAGAVYFIDYAVGKIEPDLQPLFHEGLKTLAAEAHKVNPSRAFADLSFDRQTAVLKGIEDSQFFHRAREYTLLGFLGDPKYGGNRNQVGWKHIGFDEAPMHQPPFGYYDAELLSSQKKEGQ